MLVDGFAVDALADAVEELLRDPARRARLGHAARVHAEESFDPARNARRIEDIYRSIVPSHDRIPILYVHHRPQLGGAPSSLAQLIANLDPRFEPHVFCPEGPAAELFAASGATVHTGDVSIFAHAWDSPYEGLRWLVLGREVAALPPHLRQLERLMREHRFPIVHLNDSPLLPAAQVAHRHGAKVVWHLRSALAGEGRDRRSRAIADADGALGRRGDRDRPRRRRPLPDPAPAGDRLQQRERRRRRRSTRAARRASGSPRTASRSASPASCAARRAGPSWSRPPRS